MNIENKVNQMVKKLSFKGIKPLRVDSGSELSDPAIWITEQIYIQIGHNYVVVFSNRGNNLSMFHSSMNLTDIILNLRRALDERR